MQGWSMSKKGYLPEQVIAYAMAWIAAYQKDEACAWSKFMNKTLFTYFDRSRKYILKYPEKIRFERDTVLQPEVKTELPVSESKPPVGISYDNANFSDSEPVPAPSITGKWRVTIIYGSQYKTLAGKKLQCLMELRDTGDGQFEGIAKDLEGLGMNPFEAKITGFLEGENISFVKQYKHSGNTDADGVFHVDETKPGKDVQYSGRYNPHYGYFIGEWVIEVYRIKKGKDLTYSSKGNWAMKKEEPLT